MFDTSAHVHYQKNQLVNVICQLRFPTILSIQEKIPVDFQEAVRRDFPKYSVRTEQPAPKLENRNGVLTPVKQDAVKNYSFQTLDGQAGLNLTDSFIALTVSQYEDWETFAGILDKIVADFCRIYEPACFERIGLRYMNAISRKDLDLEEYRWTDLIQPRYLGLLGDEEMAEQDFSRCTQDAEFKARGGCRAKLHCGPGLIKKNNVQDPVPRYIIDIDVFMSGQIMPRHLTGALQTAHINANQIFREALTGTLHNAMQPEAD